MTAETKEQSKTDVQPETISAREAISLISENGATSIIDVRSGAEYESAHIPGSRLIPLDQIESHVEEIKSIPAPRFLLCLSGGRAVMAKKTLSSKHQIDGLIVIDGGLEAYMAEGGATKQSKERMSLERQVRIAAGSLVLIGVVGGTLFNPLLLILSGFVGAGLIFAGVTNTCGMAILLAKMPWNRAGTVSE